MKLKSYKLIVVIQMLFIKEIIHPMTLVTLK
jgi:hypothetical protein